MKLHDTGVYLVNGVPQTSAPAGVTEADAKKGTIAYGILKAHNTGDSMQDLRMKFDSMTSHDITYVGIIQTARASGMKQFPLPYVLTNCHNSLCAVGGGRPPVCPVRRPQIRRHLCSAEHGRHPQLQPRDDVRLWADDPGL